jgi:exosortase
MIGDSLLPRTLSRNGWSLMHGIGAAAMGALAIIAMRDAWADICRLSLHHERFNHMYMVPPVALALAWVRRARVRQCYPGGIMVGPITIGLGWAASMIGYQSSVESLWHLGALVMAIGAMLTVLGRDVLVSFMPTFVALLFLVPVPGLIRAQIRDPLQVAAAELARLLLSATSIPITRAGGVLELAGQAVAIGPASGMRLLMAVMVVGFGFAFCLPLRGRVRAAILIASPVTAIICNAVAMAVTVWLHQRWPDATDNLQWVGGWGLVLLSLAAAWGLLRLLQWFSVPITRYTLAHD